MSDWAALFVGIDNYPLGATLKHAVTDAIALSEAFGFEKLPLNTLYLSPSPKVGKLSEDRIYIREEGITVRKLRKSVKALMSAEQPNILFYFSGHANMNWETGSGYLKTPDRYADDEGLSFRDLMSYAKAAAMRSKRIFIILDACNSAGIAADGNDNSSLPRNITIMAAARDFEPAIEKAGMGGVFTHLLIEGLKGGAADQAGRITAPSLHTYVDTMLTNLGQRPVFMTNVTQMITLKDVDPRVPLDTLSNLENLFENEDSTITLDPEYDPTPRKELPKKYHGTTPNDNKVEIYEQLRHLNRNGMLVPVGTEHLYNAAFENKPVELTELGKMYFKLSKMKNLKKGR